MMKNIALMFLAGSLVRVTRDPSKYPYTLYFEGILEDVGNDIWEVSCGPSYIIFPGSVVEKTKDGFIYISELGN